MDFEFFIKICTGVIGVWLIGNSLILKANNNFISGMIFKVIPFFLGICSLYISGKLWGLLP
jgi:hypothetical protein